ncbi:hypothetical protein IG631_12945 [Alternaria alternata]|nr:hypothetical protein IG631_12945 [Alternaria alternata]
MTFVRSVLERLSASWHRMVKSTTNLQILSTSAALSSRTQCTANPYLTHYNYSRGFYYVRRSVPLGYHSNGAQDTKAGRAMACTTGFTSAVQIQNGAYGGFHGHHPHRNSVSRQRSPTSPAAS